MIDTLCLAGGGIKGLSALVLKYLEEKNDKYEINNF